ncbi:MULTISPECIES: vWA domain-containing protein [Providencia]|uniref:vWA domain-containing protein n=1 Tax=Providencia TaxID=586 RepID=UPI0003E1FEC0|nr:MULTISPECIES: vWA domain-containing protein [Providencia]ETS98701.1 von Willebrand factor type A domain protein [Providencia alcalifaciens PAL-3]EUC97749.1 von Willebrand factor type A domain protein [Providencia alcalifaciens PAL-1]MBS0924954.1 VWA domain-containing protein [Providencia sp. JGM181]MBS0934794.1 VWA domain-containing protein [Providencia sp. JGM172]MBS0998933.1 VWA domain-containing protein [Providencia sp. JGM178]
MNLFKTSFFTAISAVFLLFFSSVSGAKSIVEPAKDSEVLDLVFILDKSGSMSGFESDTVGGYNSVLTENRNKAGKTFITTVLFNNKTSLLHNREPIDKVKNLTLDDYSVGGNTALLDAIGDTMVKMRENRKITKNNNVLFVIITDGEENSSTKYSQAKIKSMIKSAEVEDKWDFIFLGANIDAITAADNIGIKSSNATGYVQDGTGYDKAYKAVNKAVEAKQNAAPISEEWKQEVEQDAKDRKK